MNGSIIKNLPPALATVSTVVGLVLCSAGLLSAHDDLSASLFLLVSGAVVSILGIIFRIWHSAQQKACLRRYFDLLCRFDAEELRDPATMARLPQLFVPADLRAAALHIGQSMSALASRIEELENARRATDIRASRATTENCQIKAILAGLDDAVIAVNKYDELILANPQARALLSIDSDNANNAERRALEDLLNCRELINLLHDTCHRESDSHRSEEMQICDERKQEQWYRATISRLVWQGSDNGSKKTDDSRHTESGTQGAVAVLRCIDEQKALQRRNAEFVSAVSHEMKTPLAGIRAYVELLVDNEDEDQETREEFLSVINSQANRLQRLVDNLLNLARMEAGVVKVDKQSRPLNELLEEAARVVQPSAEAKNIQLVIDLSPLYLGILADRDMLLQAAINLLSNAIKYTHEGGTVILRSRMVDKDVSFEVEDNGVGLSEEDSRRVFEKFYRVNKNKDMAPGTGLGLPLAKHIVEDVHGGSLELTSILGQGSIFTVTLPSCGQLTQRQAAITCC